MDKTEEGEEEEGKGIMGLKARGETAAGGKESKSVTA